jgi:hypothetical protein
VLRTSTVLLRYTCNTRSGDVLLGKEIIVMTDVFSMTIMTVDSVEY